MDVTGRSHKRESPTGEGDVITISLGQILPQFIEQITATLGEALRVGLMQTIQAVSEQNERATNELIAEIEAARAAEQKNMAALVEAITAPKMIIHDENGRPIEVTK